MFSIITNDRISRGVLLLSFMIRSIRVFRWDMPFYVGFDRVRSIRVKVHIEVHGLMLISLRFHSHHCHGSFSCQC